MYKCEENEEITKLSGEVVKAIIYRAKGTTTRHLVERLDGEWRTADDPMLGKGFRQLVKIIDELDLKNIETPPADMDGYWEIMWKLQGIYANLHSVFERFSRFYLGAKISKRDYARKIDKLIKNKGIIDQIEIPFVKVHNAENASSRTTNTKTKPFATWHQVRNNMVHSGKDEPGDVKLLRNSLQGMVKLLATVIYSEIPELKRIHEPKQ